MKNTIVLFLLFIAFPIFCQETKVEFSDVFPDFTKMNVVVSPSA
jgi:hypothetical protein